jgi:hypothetical protein
MGTTTLENWREVDWDLLDIPQLECIQAKLLRERRKLQKQKDKAPRQRGLRLKKRLGTNRKQLQGVISRISRHRKKGDLPFVYKKALCLALARGEFPDEVRDLLVRAKKASNSKIDGWLHDFVEYSKRNNPKPSEDED